MSMGERIYQLRTARNLSQEELANTLEVSRQSVSKWETDGSVPELDKLVKLCEVFQVSMDYLVRGTAPAVAQSIPKGKSKETNIAACILCGVVVSVLAGLIYVMIVRYTGMRLALFICGPTMVIGIILLIVALCAAVRRRGRGRKKINKKGSEYETSL